MSNGKTRRGIKPARATAKEILHVNVCGSSREILLDVNHTPERERWWITLPPDVAEQLAIRILHKLGRDPDEVQKLPPDSNGPLRLGG